MKISFSKTIKWTIIGLFDGIGLAFFFIGALTNAYSTTIGLGIAIVFLWIAGSLIYVWGLVKARDNHINSYLGSDS